MSQSLSKVYVHITFSTKGRQHFIDDRLCNSLYEYIGGICKGLECNPVKVGGYTDYIHVLCLLSRKITQMKLLEEIKKQSSKCLPAGKAGVKTKDRSYSSFYRQDGYGIFSVNPSEVDAVASYIVNQFKHHKKVSFQDEFRAFLKKYKVEYDERYVWD